MPQTQMLYWEDIGNMSYLVKKKLAFEVERSELKH